MEFEYLVLVGSRLRRAVDINWRQEAAGDSESLLLRVFSASNYEQETPGRREKP